MNNTALSRPINTGKSELVLLQNENKQLKKQRIEILAYEEIESLVSNVETYLTIISHIGKIKNNGKKFFNIKLIKKIRKSLDSIYNYYISIDKPFTWKKWTEEKNQIAYEELKCLVAQQGHIISKAVNIYFEGYVNCSQNKLNMLFGVQMIYKDMEKAIKSIPTYWCKK